MEKKTYPVEFHEWGLEKVKCTQSLPLPDRDRDVVFERHLAQFI